MDEPSPVCARSQTAPPSVPEPASGIHFVGPGGLGRARLERFVEARFADSFGAKIREHYPVLAALRGTGGDLSAVAGVRFADREPLFLERYLDGRIEDELRAIFQRPVDRCAIVEIGSFASVSPPATLELVARLAHWLAASQGRRFAVATARPELERLLSRSGFGLRRLAAADPGRIENAQDWGAYYLGAPHVFAGEIVPPCSPPFLRARQRARAVGSAELRRIAS